MSLAQALERAASALEKQAEAIRPANGDPVRLLEGLDDEGATQVLRWLLCEEPAAGEELGYAWLELAGGAQILDSLAEAELPKAGRKALRRCLHRLRSRGVQLAPRTQEAVVATLPPLEEALTEALVTRVDPSGAQLVMLVEASPRGGVRVFQSVVDDERGVLEFHAYPTSRSRARRLLRDLGESGRLAAVAAPAEVARARLAQVVSWQPSDRPPPSTFEEWRGRITAAPEGTATPGGLARQALGGAPSAGARERVLAGIESGELGPWPPAPEALRALAERLAELARSQVLVSETQRREQAHEVLREALAERLVDQGREKLAARFEETAYALWKQSREEDARACVTVAAELRKADATAHPVARALLERALRPILEAFREAERSSLLVKP